MNTRDPSLQSLTLPCLKLRARPSEPISLPLLPLSVETCPSSRQLKSPFPRQLPLPTLPTTAEALRPYPPRSSKCNKHVELLPLHRMAQNSFPLLFLAKEKRINLDLLSNLHLVHSPLPYLNNALSHPRNSLDHRTGLSAAAAMSRKRLRR